MTIKTGNDFDVFLSHASEDKPIVLELAKLLDARDVRVWLDQGQLQLGDTLLEKIDDGLARSRFGVVVLSASFFAKAWTKLELTGLVSRETAHGAKVILPIWHQLSYEDVAAHSPILAGKLAARTEDGLEAIADQIVAVLQSPAAAPGQVVATEPRDASELSPGSLHDQIEGLLQLKDDVGLTKLLRSEQRAWEAETAGTIGQAQPASVDAARQIWERLQPATERRLASLLPLATHDRTRFDAEVRGLARALQRLPDSAAQAWAIVPQFATSLIINVVGTYLVDAERYDPVVWLLRQRAVSRRRGTTDLGSIPHSEHALGQAFGPQHPEGHPWRHPFWMALVMRPGDMTWLGERYPEFDDRERRVTTLVGLDVIRAVTLGLEDGRKPLAYYALYEDVAIDFARALHADVHRSDEISAALGIQSEAFLSTAAQALRASRELDWEHTSEYVAEILEAGR